jgi:beta-galactosidase GanA
MRRSITYSAALLATATACAMVPALADASADAPSSVTAVAGSASATIRWQSPQAVDGAPVKSFTVTASTGQQMTADEPNHFAIVPGLTNGKPVRFSVTATSTAGTSASSSAAAPVTPAPVAPPRGVLLGKTQSVSFDHYSVIIGGRRVLLWAGEFDYYRLPSPSLWIDRLEEMKAAGMNAVSIYFDWDYHSAAPGVYDFSGVRDVNRLLNDAQKVGLYVIARPGPYVNAETDAGGLAGWLASEPAGSRTNDPQYLAAADQWFSEIDPIIAAHQITRGGDVIMYQIENEYGFTIPSGEAYFGNLEAQAKQDGIDVPTYTNNVGGFPTGWAPGTPDAPDLTGTDQYPEGFDCTETNVFNAPPVLTSDHTPTQPLMVPEYQGGSFDSWGGSGYPGCATLTGPNFENTFYKYYIAQGVTMQSIYMTVGGTDWGFNPAPFMYTSYDYGSPISEPGTLSFKYPELKLTGEMSQALPDLAMTDQVTAPAIAGLTTFEERNPQTGATFLYLGNDGASPVTTTLPSGETVTVPSHEAKFLVSAASFGRQHLVSTTSELVTQTTLGPRDVALLSGDGGSAGTTSLSYSRRPAVRVLSDPSGTPVTAHWNPSSHTLTLGYTHSGLTQVSVAAGRSRLLLLLADATTAGQFWVERTAGGTLLARGSSLVRTASASGRSAALTGDTSTAGPLQVWAAPRIHALSWDGRAVVTTRARGGALTAQLPGPPSSVNLPSLSSGWKFRFESNERLPGFDDSAWTVADHQSTDNPIQPASTPVLYAQDYGFDHGFVWYRGHFTATGNETSVALTADTGSFGSFAVWLNGTYLGSASTPTSTHPFANLDDTSLSKTFTIPAGALSAGKDDVISVLTENMGQDESFENSLGLDSNKTPRGLESASLTESTGSAPALTWRLQGASAQQVVRDPVRGPTNPAGLSGSNAGWALPNFPDGSWQSVSLPDSWATRAVPPGVGWYRTHFSLNVPQDVWTPLGLRLTPPGGGSPAPGAANFQALIYLNGWLIGRYINDLGPQNTFYLPQGLLRTDGRNTLAIAEWSLAAGDGGIGQVSLVPYEIRRGGIPVQTVDSPG